MVGSVLWTITIIGFTIYSFPEKIRDSEPIQVQESFDDNDFSAKGLTSGLEQYFKEDERRAIINTYKKQKRESLLIPLYGLGVLIIWWGLLYTGFWISSGFSGDDKKKGETDE